MVLVQVFHSIASAVFCYRFNQFGKKKKKKTRFWAHLCDFKYRLAEIIHIFIKNSPKLYFPERVEESCRGKDHKMRILLVLEQLRRTQGKESGTAYEGNSIEGMRTKPHTDVTGKRDKVICGRKATVSWSFLAVGAKWVLLCRTSNIKCMRLPYASWLCKQNSQKQIEIPVLLTVTCMVTCSGLVHSFWRKVGWVGKNTEKQCEAGSENHEKSLQMNSKKFYLRTNYFLKIQIPWHCWLTLLLQLYCSQDLENNF